MKSDDRDALYTANSTRHNTGDGRILCSSLYEFTVLGVGEFVRFGQRPERQACTQCLRGQADARRRPKRKEKPGRRRTVALWRGPATATGGRHLILGTSYWVPPTGYCWLPISYWVGTFDGYLELAGLQRGGEGSVGGVSGHGVLRESCVLGHRVAGISSYSVFFCCRFNHFILSCTWLSVANYLPLFQATSRGYPTSRHAYLADPDAHDAPPASGMHVQMRSFPIVTCSGGGCETVEPVSGCSHPHWLAGSSKTAEVPGRGTWPCSTQ